MDDRSDAQRRAEWTMMRELVQGHSDLLAAGLAADALIERMTEIAMRLTGAEWVAIGVHAVDGSLERFVHRGMAAEQLARLPHPPVGLGLLGALVDERRTILLDDLTLDPRSEGVPEGHPTMRAFLGVPLHVASASYASIYLTHSRPGWFTAEHQGLVEALAGTLGIAIDYDQTSQMNRRREKWVLAVNEISAAFLAEDTSIGLEVLVNRVVELAEADSVAILAPLGEDSFVVQVASGAQADQIRGAVIPRAGSLTARAIEARAAVTAEHYRGRIPAEWGPTVAAPLDALGSIEAVLFVGRQRGGSQFTRSDIDLVSDFASQAAVGLILARNREDRERLALLEDRSRIARDLHDHVIQRLFAVGLNLQAMAPRVDARSAGELVTQISSLDQAIAEIRTAIFAMSADRDARTTLRHRIIDLVGELSQGMAFVPQLSFAGAVDLLVPEAMVEDVMAVLRETLTNVVKHARASFADVSVSAHEDGLRIAVVDDGIGLPAVAHRSSGTANLSARAESWRGSFTLSPHSPQGTEAVWAVTFRQKEVAE